MKHAPLQIDRRDNPPPTDEPPTPMIPQDPEIDWSRPDVYPAWIDQPQPARAA